MKRGILILMLSVLFVSCQQTKTDEKAGEKSSVETKNGLIKVGVFEGNGGAQTCIWETCQALKIDKDMDVKTITTSQIAEGGLEVLDVLVIPGGGGSRQYQNLGGENIERVKEFVRNGKGVVGICAGAFLFSNTPEYSCLNMNGMKAIDIEHDNRGHGVAEISLTGAGKEFFKEVADKDRLRIIYYEGPVFEDITGDEINTEVLGMMESDVHIEGNAPANMTNNKPFFIRNEYGKGRVFCTIAHPENTPGMRWLIAKMARWAGGFADKVYSKSVDSQKMSKENLMSLEDLEKESACFKKLLYGSEEDKIACLDFLEGKHSWDAKRWLQGLVFDSSAKVRARAAKYITDIEYTQYLPEVKAALKAEKDAEAKKVLEESAKKLESMIGAE